MTDTTIPSNDLVRELKQRMGWRAEPHTCSTCMHFDGGDMADRGPQCKANAAMPFFTAPTNTCNMHAPGAKA